jgi:hypothetical protein
MTLNERADNIYYNFKIKQGENSIYDFASTSETRNIPILYKSDEYEMAVARFSLPMTAVPIFIWKENYFKITISFNISIITKTLQFIPNSSGNDFYGDTIWNYQEFIDIINAGLKEAYDDLKIAEPTWTATEAPFLSFNSSSRLLVWNVEQAYGTTAGIYFNKPLFYLMNSFQAFETTIIGEEYYQILSKDNKNNSNTINGKPYYSTKQEYSTLFLWNEFKTILFESDSIPVDSEYIMAQQNDFRKLVTDFEPLQDESNKNTIQYFPQGPLRWYNLFSDKSLDKMDLKIFWADDTGKTYPLYIDEKKVFSMKIYFRKKII